MHITKAELYIRADNESPGLGAMQGPDLDRLHPAASKEVEGPIGRSGIHGRGRWIRFYSGGGSSSIELLQVTEQPENGWQRVAER